MDIRANGSLTERAAAALNIAYEQAEHLENSHVAVEHLLLGLVYIENAKDRRRHSGGTGHILRDAGLTERRIEEVIRRQNVGFARRYIDSPPLSLSTDARHALRLAQAETHWMDQEQMDTGHLLLGVLLEPKGVAALRALRTDIAKVREQLRGQLPLTKGTRGRHRSPYTQSARLVVDLAKDEARELRYDQIGTEHLLIAMLRERTGIAGRVLKNLGLQPDHVRGRILQLAPPHSTKVEIMGLSMSYKRLLNLAGDEMRTRNHQFIGTGHLLMYLMRFVDDVAVRALRRLSIKPEDVFDQLEQYMPLQTPVLEGVEGGDLAFIERPVSFTPQVQLVLNRAFEEAQRLDHLMLNTGHVLMGLMLEESSTTTVILQAVGLNRRRVRGLIELVSNQQYRYTIKPFRLAQDVEDMLKIAAEQQNGAIDALGLLYALCTQVDTVAAQVFTELEIDPQQILHQLRRK